VEGARVEVVEESLVEVGVVVVDTAFPAEAEAELFDVCELGSLEAVLNTVVVGLLDSVEDVSEACVVDTKQFVNPHSSPFECRIRMSFFVVCRDTHLT